MKKIILFLLIISCIFIKPNIDVKADASVPVITAYEAIITNPDGAKTYNSEWISENEITDVIIPYDKEVIVVSETYDALQVKYNNIKYTISKNDITPKNGEYALKNAIKLDSSQKVLNLYERKMYSGPSTKFKEIISIPEKIELSYEYAINASYAPSWIYIEYKNQKGWIQTLDSRGNLLVATEVDYNVVAIQDFELDNQHIDKGTVFKCLYYCSNPGGEEYYVQYNDKIVMIHSPLVEKTDAVIEQQTESNKIEENENIVEHGIPDDKQIEKETKKTQQENKIDYYTIIYLCIGAAVLIALTSMVTIILINKKNKDKINNESQSINKEDNVEK